MSDLDLISFVFICAAVAYIWLKFNRQHHADLAERLLGPSREQVLDLRDTTKPDRRTGFDEAWDYPGVSWQEAKPLMLSFIQDKKRELGKVYDDRRRHFQFIYIITGCGRHSTNNLSLLMTQVKKFLNDNGYSHSYYAPAIIKVDLDRKKH